MLYSKLSISSSKTGSPILPPAFACFPIPFNICSRIEVTVVFPFEPVMQIVLL